MGRIRVKYNHLPAIARAMPGELEQDVDGTAKEMADVLQRRVWFDTGVVHDTTSSHLEGVLHAEVWCGLHENRGFYSRFQEWGTYDRSNARPRVGPLAMEYEPIYARNMVSAIKRAVRAQ